MFKTSPQLASEVLPNYSQRELCLFDRPIVFYGNDSGEQIFVREGGTPVIDLPAIREIAHAAHFVFDCDAFATWITNKYVGRKFYLK